jgi:hypothetical protein
MYSMDVMYVKIVVGVVVISTESMLRVVLVEYTVSSLYAPLHVTNLQARDLKMFYIQDKLCLHNNAIIEDFTRRKN